jgi:hypothetical protein
VTAVRYFFAGGEVCSYRRLLEGNGHHTIAMSFVGLSRRTRFRKPWAVSDHFSPDTEVLLDSGAYTFNREGSTATEQEAVAMAVAYMSFVRHNASHLDGVTEFDALILGDAWIRGAREDFYDDLGPLFIPVWHSLSGVAELEHLAGKYGRVGILQDDADEEDHEAMLQQLAAAGIRLHGMGMTRTRTMRQIAWDSVSSTSWLSPVQYGDLIIWDANKLHRYPRTRREHGLRAYQAKLEAEGFDTAAIAAGKQAELLRLSAWSWSQYVSWINDARPTAAPAAADPGAGAVVAVRPQPRERVILPLISTTVRPAGDGDGQAGSDDNGEAVVTAAAAPLMQCSTCYIRRECPEFSDGASCKYEIPVQVESGNQLRAVLNTIIRIQAQRALVMTMMEQAKGGYADANTGAEIDRLARLVRLRSDAEKSSVTLSLTASGPAARQGGYLSSLFGKEAGDRATALPEPLPAAEILGIVDAEIME